MLTKKTVVFLAALLALLLVVNRYAARMLDGGGAAGVQPATLLPGAGTAVPWSAFSVSNATCAVRAERSSDGRWNLVGADAAPAASAVVSLVLDTVANARVLDRVTARQRASRELSAADFGFGPPRASVRLERTGAAPVLVEFGGETPGGDAVFVRVDGSADYYAVDRAALDALPASADELRDRILFVPPGREIVSLSIRDRERGEIRLEAGAGGRWSLVAPFECPASPAAVEPLLRSLESCVAERFVPARETLDAGLSPDETRLVLSLRTTGEPADRTFAFGKADPAAPSFVYVAALGSPGCFTVDRTVLDALLMPLDVLREHRILPYGREDLRSLSFESAAGAFELARADGERDGAWTIRRPTRQPADPIATAAFLDTLLAMRDIAAEADPPEAPPPALSTVSLVLDPFPPLERREFTLALEPAPDGAATNLVVSSPGRALRQFADAARAPAAAFSFSALSSLRNKTILALPADAAPGLDPELAALLADFRARAVVALFASDSAAFGLLPPRAEKTVRTTLPDRPVVILQVGAALPDGGAYLRVKGSDEVFEIDPEAAELLLR